MAQLLDLMQLGNPILRKKAAPVANVFDDEIQTLIDNMLVTVKSLKGVGLAAPQVGVSKRLFIVCPEPNQRYPHISIDETLVVINPTITPSTKKTIPDWEGCLSIPGLRGLVPRHDHINVSYTNRIGEHKSENYSGFVSRIFQHECDHLDGIMFLDRMIDISSLMTEDEYFRQQDDEFEYTT